MSDTKGLSSQRSSLELARSTLSDGWYDGCLASQVADAGAYGEVLTTYVKH